jgi:2-polyprenyl-3-methyl-5-hydroxy-6-metoxy-1,4-benzoquinol methylase
MDDPDLAVARHEHALRGLVRLNRVSGSVGTVWSALRDLATADGDLRVLDVATGAGDLPAGLWRRARRAGVRMTVDACDVSATAVAFARRRAAAAGAEVTVFRHDALDGPLPDGYDVVVCSLFLHHLTEERAASLLERMAAAARRRMIVHDLERSRANLTMVGLAARLVTRSDVVHTDGPRSVRAAFTLPELAALARRRAGAGVRVRRCFPCRLLLTRDAPP